MKNVRFSLWLAAAFLAGAMASWLLTIPPAWAQPAQNPAERRWKYLCERSNDDIEDWLNKVGNNGWELATVDSQGLYCMKKLK